MSLIPSTAIGAALTPVQRSANDLLRARRVQSAKDNHHAEEVEEIDDTAVNSIHDSARERGGRGQEEKPARKKSDEERVDIASLEGVPRTASKKETAKRLDISA